MECNCEIINITQGTDISLKVTLTRGGEAFPVELSEQVAVAMVSERGERVAVDFTVGDEGRLLVTLRSDDFRTGRYGLEVVGVLNGAKWRAFGQSVVRYTFETVKGAERVAVQGDEYDVTLDVGLVSDIVPKRTSELLNDGADGEHPFVSEDELAAVATSGSYNDLKDKPLLNYIPASQKGTAGGVAELNGDGKIPTAQAQFALRGNLVAADIDSTALQSGFYRVIGQRLGSDILGGDEANGVLIQYSDGYKEQVLHVGRTAGAAAGEQVETYTRRYLPTPKRWTAWYKAAGGGGGTSDDIYVVHIRPDGSNFTLVEPVQEVSAARDAGKTLIGIVEGVRMGGVLSYLPGNDGPGEIPLACAYEVHTGTMKYDVYTISIYGENDNVRIVKESIAFNLGKMTAAEAEAGNLTTARTIAPSTLKGAILYHTSDLVNGGAYNSTSKKIELKHGSTVVAEIDAAPFIVDGMVDDVRIENGNLVIDFNIESGKKDVEIPLTDIFDPSNYYTKQQTDGLLSGKASTADVGELRQQVAGKQDTIQDLAEIRAGAAAGATALQVESDPTVPAWAKQQSKPTYTAQEVGALPSDTLLFSGSYNDLSDKPTIPTVPTNVSAFTNDAGYLTSHQDISGKEDKMDIIATSGSTLTAEVGKYYTLSDVGTLAITLPTITSGITKVQTVIFYIAAGSSPTVTFTSTHPVYYSDGFEIESDSTYEVNALWNGAAWIVASVNIIVA